MTFNDRINDTASKKISIVEIDRPLTGYTWINYQNGIWFTRLTPGSQLVEDDNGNFGYWGGQNTNYYNIQSLNVQGSQYAEASSLALCISTERTWYYDTATTDMYIHFDDWKVPEEFGIINPGAAIGFTQGIDETCNNYFEDIYYEPIVTGIPNLSKKKDTLFYGILQFQSSSITFDNTDGYFDDFSQADLYGQPVRIKMSFQGLTYQNRD